MNEDLAPGAERPDRPVVAPVLPPGRAASRPRQIPDYATLWAEAGGPPGMHDRPLQVRWYAHPNDVCPASRP